MTVDASMRLQRILAVFPLFADGEELSVAELEGRTGVDASTLLDDLAALTSRDDEPGGFVEGVAVTLERERISIRSTHFLRPMRLGANELAALELGLAMLGAHSAQDDRSAVLRARARIREMIGQLPPVSSDRLWDSAPPSHADPAIVDTLRDAHRERRKVHIQYRKGSDPLSSDRIVHPYLLAAHYDTWFLAGHCERSGELRFFRADRIENARALEDRFDLPDGTTLEALMPDGKPLSRANVPTMTVRYSSRIARWIAEREGLSVADDGTLTFEFPLADEGWALRHVLQYGPDAEVIAPTSMRAKIRDALGFPGRREQ